MGKGYVSDFTKFINQYLEEHPEVVEGQRRRWGFFWKPNTETNAPEKVAKPKSEKNPAG